MPAGSVQQLAGSRTLADFHGECQPPPPTPERREPIGSRPGPVRKRPAGEVVGVFSNTPTALRPTPALPAVAGEPKRFPSIR